MDNMIDTEIVVGNFELPSSYGVDDLINMTWRYTNIKNSNIRNSFWIWTFQLTVSVVNQPVVHSIYTPITQFNYDLTYNHYVNHHIFNNV